jgi:hypothetical protein
LVGWVGSFGVSAIAKKSPKIEHTVTNTSIDQRPCLEHHRTTAYAL